MVYTMKSGILYQDPNHNVLAKVKSSLTDSVKKIFVPEGEMVLETKIRTLDPEHAHCGDVRWKEYVLEDQEGNIIAEGLPEYAAGDDPDMTGWPICRMPRVDHAKVVIGGGEYTLCMENEQNYIVLDDSNTEVIRIVHKGITGGWKIENGRDFSPEVLCGVFIFCRYIEQENEFMMV